MALIAAFWLVVVIVGAVAAFVVARRRLRASRKTWEERQAQQAGFCTRCGRPMTPLTGDGTQANCYVCHPDRWVLCEHCNAKADPNQEFCGRCGRPGVAVYEGHPGNMKRVA